MVKASRFKKQRKVDPPGKVHRPNNRKRSFLPNCVIPVLVYLTVLVGLLAHHTFLRLDDAATSAATTRGILAALQEKTPELPSVTLFASDEPVNDNESKPAAISSATSKAAGERKYNALTIGYFISITACNPKKLGDGAAVLKHSIHLNSIHGSGRYDYKMHAIVHPDAMDCVEPLAELGYELAQRDTPVAVADIQGEFLRSRISGNGCCGEKENIKLEAYTFTQFPIVVHVDVDVLILKPLDPLFDAMLETRNSSSSHNHPLPSIEAMRYPIRPVPSKINAFFTRDYNVANPNTKHKPVQGGLLVLRPSKSVYDELVAIIKKGDFREGSGWGGSAVGPFYGAMTIQGLLPYYYNILHPGESVDLNHCVYNQMATTPRVAPDKSKGAKGTCRTGEDDCEDCRNRPLNDIVSAHFTICQKPWFCLPYLHDIVEHRLCRKIVGEWFRVRSSMERSWGRSEIGPGEWKDSAHFFGYCTEKEKAGYVPVEKPYGRVAAS